MNVAVGTQPRCLADIVQSFRGRQHGDRQQSRRRIGAYFAQYLKTGHPRQVEVEQHEHRELKRIAPRAFPAAAKKIEGFDAVAAYPDVLARQNAGKGIDNQPRIFGLIFDQQDGGRVQESFRNLCKAVSLRYPAANSNALSPAKGTRTDSGYHRRMRRSITLLACLAAFSAPAVLAEGLPDLGEIAQTDLSPQMEKRIGESIMQEVRLREPSYLDDPEINSYVNRLGRRLASNSEEARQEFEFFVLRDSTLNAFAMPGGFIGVHTGLIMAAQSESELASVLSHEISHVTQRHIARGLNKQSQSYATTLLSLAVAILAGRNNPDVAQGVLMAGQAAGASQQLKYSRDFEREADRVGLHLLERSGFDVRGMGAFFERLQRFGRLYDNNAPGYLLTHPLTTERIADMENRIQLLPYRQVPDSVDFLLVRAKLKAQEGTAQDAVEAFAIQVKERKFISEAAARYGLALAHWRAKAYAAAEVQVAELRRLKVASFMVDTLAADLRLKQGDAAGAVKLLQAAALRYPQERAVAYDLVEAQLESGRPEEALKTTIVDLQAYTTDARMHALQARTYAMLGKRLQQHRAQGEAYALQGQLMPAIEQFEFAQKSPDGDFYEHSQVDARLRQLKRQQLEEAKQKRQQ